MYNHCTCTCTIIVHVLLKVFLLQCTCNTGYFTCTCIQVVTYCNYGNKLLPPTGMFCQPDVGPIDDLFIDLPDIDDLHI